MPGFTPGRRWQPAYYAFHNETYHQKSSGDDRTAGQEAAFWLPDVRQLLAAGNRFHLPDGMPQRSCATVHAAVQLQNIAMWITPARVSGTRSMSVRKSLDDQKTPGSSAAPGLGKSGD